MLNFPPCKHCTFPPSTHRKMKKDRGRAIFFSYPQLQNKRKQLRKYTITVGRCKFLQKIIHFKNNSMTQQTINKISLSGGDLSILDEAERVEYYTYMCVSNQLDPLSTPFNFMEEDKKLKLYCNKGGANQLARIHKVSHKIIAREIVDNVYVVTSCAYTLDRQTENIGAVPLYREGGEWKAASSGKRFFEKNGQLENLVGDPRANAMMKAETKSKRRATLDLLAIGMLSEEEVESIPTAKTYTLDQVKGGIQPGQNEPPHGATQQQAQHNAGNSQHLPPVNTQQQSNSQPEQQQQQQQQQQQPAGKPGNPSAGINNAQQQQNINQGINNANSAAAAQHQQNTGATSPWTKKYNDWNALSAILQTVRTVKDLAILHANNTHLVPMDDEQKKGEFSARRSLIVSGNVPQI